MTTVVVTHGVGDMEKWLAGGNEGLNMFKAFCTSYQVFKHVERSEVSIVWQGVDLEKMEAVLGSPETQQLKERHTVLDPVEVYIELVDGR